MRKVIIVLFFVFFNLINFFQAYSQDTTKVAKTVASKPIKLCMEITNCELKADEIYANEIEYENKATKHLYVAKGLMIGANEYKLNITDYTYDVFGRENVNNVWTKIVDEIINGVRKGNGRIGAMEYQWKAKYNKGSGLISLSMSMNKK